LAATLAHLVTAFVVAFTHFSILGITATTLSAVAAFTGNDIFKGANIDVRSSTNQSDSYISVQYF